jgi:hypothetical protein
MSALTEGKLRGEIEPLNGVISSLLDPSGQRVGEFLRKLDDRRNA